MIITVCYVPDKAITPLCTQVSRAGLCAFMKGRKADELEYVTFARHNTFLPKYKGFHGPFLDGDNARYECYKSHEWFWQ